MINGQTLKKRAFIHLSTPTSSFCLSISLILSLFLSPSFCALCLSCACVIPPLYSRTFVATEERQRAKMAKDEWTDLFRGRIICRTRFDKFWIPLTVRVHSRPSPPNPVHSPRSVLSSTHVYSSMMNSHEKMKNRFRFIADLSSRHSRIHSPKTSGVCVANTRPSKNLLSASATRMNKRSIVLQSRSRVAINRSQSMYTV